MLKRDNIFNELFIKPICGLYQEQSITVDEFKDRHESIMKNRWVETSHGMKGDKIYGMFDPTVDSDIMKENLQEWLYDNQLEVTECISIALHNHERTYSEWFRYVDSCSGPDELALYYLSRKMGIHMTVFNKATSGPPLQTILLTQMRRSYSCVVLILFSLAQPTTVSCVTLDSQVKHCP